jgi:hypothetical protein
MIIPLDRLGEETRILARLSQGERIDHFDTIRLRKDGTTFELPRLIPAYPPPVHATSAAGNRRIHGRRGNKKAPWRQRGQTLTVAHITKSKSAIKDSGTTIGV